VIASRDETVITTLTRCFYVINLKICVSGAYNSRELVSLIDVKEPEVLLFEVYLFGMLPTDRYLIFMPIFPDVPCSVL